MFTGNGFLKCSHLRSIILTNLRSKYGVNISKHTILHFSDLPILTEEFLYRPDIIEVNNIKAVISIFLCSIMIFRESSEVYTTIWIDTGSIIRLSSYRKYITYSIITLNFDCTTGTERRIICKHSPLITVLLFRDNINNLPIHVSSFQIHKNPSYQKFTRLGWRGFISPPTLSFVYLELYGS